MKKEKIENLLKRIDEVGIKGWNPSHEEIIAGFINKLPRELHDQMIKYIEQRIHELEGAEEST